VIGKSSDQPDPFSLIELHTADGLIVTGISDGNGAFSSLIRLAHQAS